MSTPYRDAAAVYLNAGWWPIPLGERSKFPPPEGYTGKDGKPVTLVDYVAHFNDPSSANIAIRLPREVIGIDVDAYGGKPGAQTLAELEHHHGQLPATVMVTSRADGVSGIRLYRLPTGADEAKFRTGWPGIEIVRYGHRYAVAPPSIHPDTNAPYRWLTTAGEDADLPTPESLPELPEAWVAALVKETAPSNKDKVSAPKPAPTGKAVACRVAPRWLTEALAELTSGASRHDVATRQAATAARLEDFGHDMAAVLEQFGATFTAAILDRLPRPLADVEWRSIVETARALVAKDPTPEADKGCCTEQNHLRDATDLLRAGTLARAALMAPEPTPAPVAPESEGETEAEASSWAPVDLAPYWSGLHQRPQTALLAREDQTCLLYPARVHSFYGESESGKSWLAQIATAEALVNGKSVAYIDFEADAGDIVERLRLLGLKAKDANRLRYLRPDTPRDASDPYWQELLATPTDLVIIDGVTEALTMWGGETKDNDTITQWTRKFPRAIARATGAAVVTVDHVPKDKENRGRFAIGGQAKLAALDGAAYLIEPLEVLAPGRVGLLTVRVTKDRPGTVRAKAGEWRKSDRTQEAAVARIDASGETITWQLLEPRSEEEIVAQRRSTLDHTIMGFVIDNPGIGLNTLHKKGAGSKEVIRPRIAALVEDGYLVNHGKGTHGTAMVLVPTEKGVAEFKNGQMVTENVAS